MNSTIFPEDMNPVSKNLTEAVRQMEDYMRYMTERMNFYASVIEKRLADMETRLKTLEE